MLYWQHFNLTCLPEKVLKEVHEQMNLLVKQEIPSIIMHQRIALDLAAGPLNAGSIGDTIFLRDSKRAPSGKNFAE